MPLDPNQRAPQLIGLEDAETQATQFESRVRGRAREIARELGTGTRDLYQRVRNTVEPVFRDRALHEDIARLRAMLSASPP